MLRKGVLFFDDKDIIRWGERRQWQGKDESSEDRELIAGARLLGRREEIQWMKR